MPTLTVAGHDVTVGDGFAKLSPEDQQAMVNQIAQHLPGQKTSEEPSGIVAGFQHGLAGVAGGDASTANLAGVPTGPLDAAKENLEPKNYKAAPLIREGGHWYNPLDYQPSSIPQIAAETLPGMGQDMAAGYAAGKLMPGGLPAKALASAGGYAGSALLRTFGPGAHEKADARTGIPNSPVEGRDIAREGASQAMTLPLNMVGANRLLPAPTRVAGSVLAKLGKTLGIEGAVGGATDALDQAATTAGSKNGFDINGNRVATAAASRALGSTVMASPKATSEANANRKFAGYEATPETTAAAQAVAARRAEYADGRDLVGPMGGTKVAAEAANGAHSDIHSELAAATRGEQLSQDNANVLARINSGDAVSPGQVAKLGAEASPETMHLVQQALISKNENARGNLTDKSYTGGIGGAMENLPVIRTPVKAALTTGGAAALGALGIPGVGHAVGAVAVPAAAATAGVYGLGRLIDRFTGARSPAQAFNDRFGGTDALTRLATPAAPESPEAPPVTTSVPQTPPPQNTALWGNVAPKPPTPSEQNADIRGMLLMAAARRKMAEAAQQPVAADVPAPAGLPPKPAPIVPAPASAPEAPAAPATPSVEQLLSKLKATSAAKAAQNPAATPPGGVVAPTEAAQAPVAPAQAPEAPMPSVLPMPKVSTLTKLTGQEGIKEKTGASEYMDPDTGEMLTHTPLTKDQLYGRTMSHAEFAKHEFNDKLASGAKKHDGSVFTERDRGPYENGVIHDRLSRERELQLLSQHEASPDDTPLAKLLLQELHHTRREHDARSAIKFYTSHMSPGMRRASAHLMSRHGPFSSMWSK